ncbi:methionine ABC transporter ATP-binding protein [[Clostridium] polysaccharolyticum]|uniref:D-methionine transport system ATP-binding protein n=1 Tax=[Clostridium] polysaccharolyticum TaxID=29364 RepID=A0A1I0EJ45_9FIRM|nr:ATP-binding cassette domain-containing protein [[Clostridium] polysaccharolyticum]SET45183.1 D-methionine transport system ATP-binding protein [[Clostridium] polysaccharolyticum]
MIEIKNLVKEFGTGSSAQRVLNDISLTIEDGDIFGIIGMSGAGKSTLIRCINLLEKPTEGEILINGTDITKLKKKELLKYRRNIGMIFQSFNLHMQRNVRRNASFGLELIPPKDYLPDGYTQEEYAKLSYFRKKKAKKADMKKTVDELLEIVDLHHKENAYPAQLSGGQRQRIAIARALATYPSILLCDEATSALDSMTTESILQLLQKINKERNITIVIITHEIDVVKKICNKVAVLDQSRVVETGNTDKVFSNPSSPVTKRLLGGDE